MSSGIKGQNLTKFWVCFRHFLHSSLQPSNTGVIEMVYCLIRTIYRYMFSCVSNIVKNNKKSYFKFYLNNRWCLLKKKKQLTYNIYYKIPLKGDCTSMSDSNSRHITERKTCMTDGQTDTRQTHTYASIQTDMHTDRQRQRQTTYIQTETN